MLAKDINIRDPFILHEGDTYYLFGTRAKNFGVNVKGFDVYLTKDLKNFSEPKSVFEDKGYFFENSTYWAPEVHKFNDKFYMFATFTKPNGLRGTYSLVSDTPEGPFELNSKNALTPYEWESLDGTLYIENGEPYLVFCREHTRIIDGTVEYIKLNKTLSQAVSEPVTLFKGSEPFYILHPDNSGHYVTDGPFMFRTKKGRLLLIWSTFIDGKYAQCAARSDNDSITGNFIHLDPLITDDGGHGMIFEYEGDLMLTFHTPNKTGYERPVFYKIQDLADTLKVIK